MAELDLNSATGVDLKLPLAGAGSRAYAYLIDWHIRVAGVLLWLLGWLAVSFPFDLDRTLDDRNSMLWLVTVPSLFYLLYHPVVELIMRGDSPGKRWAGVRCVAAAGGAPGSGAILLRNILRIVDALPAFYTVGMLSIILNDERQRLGDMVAGTRVVIASDDGAVALQRLTQIEGAKVAPQEAELVAELLDRWHSLSDERRRSLATAVLERSGQVAAARDAGLRSQLTELLGR
ncbi:MAG: RDD family protein [Pseudomonadales bacterium]